MTKPIPMTIEKFFKQIKPLHTTAHLTSSGEIRFKGGSCPLQAVHKVVNGRGCRADIGTLEDRFQFRDDSRRPQFTSAVEFIVNAADAREVPDNEVRFTTRLRRRMLRTLGLKSRYER